jgi:NDP-4-keto-2,6-dideoxyhexose 3-C-methyltransferase
MREISNCRACLSPDLIEVLNLGEQYVSDFRETPEKPSKYPLEVVLCNECKLVQLRHTTPPHEMYHENYGFKSGISDTIKNDLEDNVKYALHWKRKADTWLDIASNDGTLLSFVPKDIYRAGVDPITKYCKEAEQHADLIINDFFKDGQFDRLFDVVTAISCFYDMDDPNQFVGDVSKILAPYGVWVIQQNYLLTTMQLNAVDNTSHEHLEYYSLLALENLLRKFGLEVIDVQTSTINGGSLRTAVAWQGHYEVQETVQKQRAEEARFGLDKAETYPRFGENVQAELKKLKRLIERLNDEQKTVYLLAASTRGATIWQSAGITEQDCPHAVERNPEKVGKYFSAVGCKIISEEQAHQDKPDYMLVGPWFFRDEIVKREAAYIKNGGALIFPLPKLEIVNAYSLPPGFRPSLHALLRSYSRLYVVGP